jgi:antitoxin FitA
MAQFTVRNLEDEVALRLKQRAAKRGRSMEEEVRRVLRESVRDELESVPLGTRIAARFAGLGFTGELPELRGREVIAPDFAAAKSVGAKAKRR